MVQAQISSSEITSPIMLGAGGVRGRGRRSPSPDALAREACSSAGPRSLRWSLSLVISSFGESGLPLSHAGQWSWQRPHSAQAYRSRSCHRVKPSMRLTPYSSSPRPPGRVA